MRVKSFLLAAARLGLGEFVQSSGAAFNYSAFRSIDSRSGPGRRGVVALHRKIGNGLRPHQNQRECARRIAQIAVGQIRFHTIMPTGADKGKGFARAARRRAELGRP